MKQFNKTIRVEVSLDQIASNLLSRFKEDEKHAEAMTETIISLLDKSDNVSYLYNTLNGFTNDINFEIGDVIMCKDTAYFRGQNETRPSTQVIGECEIIDIDIYNKKKLKVAFTSYEIKDDEYVPVQGTTEWVSHFLCDKIPVEEPEMVESH